MVNTCVSFNDLVASLDSTCLNIFGETASFQPQTGEAPITITGITSPPPMLEDALSGGTTGVTNVYFFVRFEDITPNPRRGDVLTYGGVTYDITDVLVDRGGGALLKLRRNA